MVMRPALVNVMVMAAEKAAKGLKRDFGEVENLQISRKGPADFVSTADLKSQKVLREELGKARPKFGFVMEEDDKSADTSAASERWIVDPLDGTTNFLHGVPLWAISIAAEREGEIVAGVIYNPITDELFWAEKGLGAYLNNQRLRVSGRTDLTECLLASGLPFKGSKKDPEKLMAQVHKAVMQTAGVRRMGSAAIDLAYVAAGRFDGYWEGQLGMWDVAAGSILVKEAGGMISPLEKGLHPVHDASIIASNAGIHEKLLKMLQG